MDQLIPNLSNEPFRFTPLSPATRPQSVDPVLDGLPAQLAQLFVSAQGRHRLQAPNARAQCCAITAHVAASLHVNCDVLLSRNRCQHVSFVRQIAMYLCRELTAGSWHTLGDYFGRNHATVIHAVGMIRRRMSDPVSGPVFSKLIARLEEQITATTTAPAKAAA